MAHERARMIYRDLILYYGTIKRFLRPEAHQLIDIFEEPVYDQKRGWIGGPKKLQWAMDCPMSL